MFSIPFMLKIFVHIFLSVHMCIQLLIKTITEYMTKFQYKGKIKSPLHPVPPTSPEVPLLSQRKPFPIYISILFECFSMRTYS